MNLYLYIPPASSQPPSCLKGLIADELHCYHKQNNTENFQNMLVKFISRLLDRGHTIKELTPLLLEAASTLDKLNIQQNSNDRQSTLYLLFDTTFKDTLPFDRMQVAVSRPKNLKDILTKATTQIPKHLNIDQIIDQLS